MLAPAGKAPGCPVAQALGSAAGAERLMPQAIHRGIQLL
jgi:hypothetical protein